MNANTLQFFGAELCGKLLVRDKIDRWDCLVNIHECFGLGSISSFVHECAGILIYRVCLTDRQSGRLSNRFVLGRAAAGP